ncbi:MAG: fibronectin type III domain-containing protein, partial [Bacteroidales bacterium]|nr:fibronectin type III domain-containing protein [Bacteroidales bacterium]
TLPYTMDFEGLASSGSNGNIPSCWTWVSGHQAGSNPCPHGGYAHNGSVSLSMYMNGSSTISGMGNLIALPNFDNLSTLSMAFFAYQEQSNPADVFAVGVMEGSVFVPIDTIALANDTYTEYVVNFSSYEGTGTQPAFRAFRNNGSMHVYIDDITVDVTSSCQYPTNIHATSATSTEVSLTWNGDESISYEIYYQADSAVADLADLYATDYASTNSATLYNLTPLTTYHVYIRANCGNQYSNWGHGIVNTTLCDNMCELVFDMVDSYGDGWNGNAINVMQAGATMGSATIGTGSSATATISVCPTDTISLVWQQGSYAGETSFTVKDSWNNELYSCANGSTISGTFFTYVTTCQAPACPAPRNLSVFGVDSNSAWVRWVDTTSTSWVIEYGPVGFTLGQGTTVTSTDDSVQITGLSASSNYQVYVFADCGDTLVGSNPLTFMTGCGTISMLPYSENFDTYSEGQVPTCWTQIHNSGVNPCVSVASYLAHSGSAFISMWHNAAGAQNTIASPMFEDLDGMQLTFWARYNNSVPHFSVGVIDAMGSYIPMDTISLTDTWVEHTIYLSDYAQHGNRVAFHTTCPNNNTNIAYIDDVVFDIMPDCTPIASISITDSATTTTSVEVTWVDTVNTAWEYIFDTVAITNSALYTPTTVATNTLTLTGLAAAHTYHIYVRPVCGGVTPWASTVANTLVCDNGCDVVINMYDTYGDGWNGNAINVVQAGITMGTTNFTNGSAATQSISVCPGTPINFQWISGSFTTETSFEINDAWGNNIYPTTSGTAVSGTFFTHTTNCVAPT